MKMRRLRAAALALLLCLGLAACSSGSGSSLPGGGAGGTGASAQGEEPFTITMLRPLYDAEPPKEDSPVQKEMEQRLQVRFESRWVPSATFTEVFNTTLATQDVPMVISVPSSLSVNPGFMKYCNAGVFWDLTERIQNSTVLFEEQCVTEDALQATSIDGRYYMIPLLNPAARVGIIYRKDWADAVGAEPPTSVESFLEMARLFTENDPDGNGQDDTYGFSYNDDGDKDLAYSGFTTIAVALGAPNLWGEVDGKILPYFETEPYMQTLELFKELYDKGYMNEDFYLIKGNDKYSGMLSGKGGMMMTSATNAAFPGGKYDALLNENPDAEIAYTSCLMGQEGEPVTNSVISVGALGGVVFPQSACTEEELERIFGIMEQIKSDEELDKLTIFGIEGLHYTVENGRIVQTDEQLEAYRLDGSANAFGSLLPRRVLDDYGQQLTPSQQITKALYPNEPYAVPDISAGRMDGEMLAKMTSISDIISDARVKYIIGQIDRDGFLAAVQQWKDAGGQEIIDSLNR